MDKLHFCIHYPLMDMWVVPTFCLLGLAFLTVGCPALAFNAILFCFSSLYTHSVDRVTLAPAGHTLSPIECPPFSLGTEQALIAFSPLGAAGIVSFFHIKINTQGFLGISPGMRRGRSPVLHGPCARSFPPGVPTSESRLWVPDFSLGSGLSFIGSPTGSLAVAPSFPQLLLC